MSARTMTNDFIEREVPFRGVVYKLRELSAEEYDSCIKMAAKGEDDTDLVVLNKLMILKCLVEPTLTADELAAKPYRLTRALGRAVNELHYSDDAELPNV